MQQDGSEALLVKFKDRRSAEQVCGCVWLASRVAIAVCSLNAHDQAMKRGFEYRGKELDLLWHDARTPTATPVSQQATPAAASVAADEQIIDDGEVRPRAFPIAACLAARVLLPRCFLPRSMTMTTMTTMATMATGTATAGVAATHSAGIVHGTA